ncbi:MAG: serine/threonine-protein phosphatase [Marinilabiliales bacterium]|nr:serine/threonine-protein phosphatase [Marinilabiliales bacterium]
MSAALLMSNFQASLRCYLHCRKSSLEEMIRKLNTLVVINSAGRAFHHTVHCPVTTLNTRVLEYVNAAHNPPVMIDLSDKPLVSAQTVMRGCGHA